MTLKSVVAASARAAGIASPTGALLQADGPFATDAATRSVQES
jgi:hypothetical protein